MIIDPGIVAIFVTILLSVVATSFGYGILTNRVSSNSSEIEEMKLRDKDITKKLDDLRLLVQSIATRLDK